MIEVLGIPDVRVHRFWGVVRGEVERALAYSHGEFTIDDVLERLVGAKMQLWMVLDDDAYVGVVITEIVNYPQVRAVRFLALAGKRLDDWMEQAEKHIVGLAREWGCRVSEGYGRIGWLRKTKPLGYTFGHVMVRKEI